MMITLLVVCCLLNFTCSLDLLSPLSALYTQYERCLLSHNRAFEECRPLYPKGMNRKCIVGYVISHSVLERNISKTNLCQYRTIHERKSLLQSGDSISSNFAVALVEELFKMNFRTLLFLGDSVSGQLAHFLICDLLRSGNTTISPGTYFGSTTFSLTNGNPLKLTIIHKRFTVAAKRKTVILNSYDGPLW
jgi:hypothetical protein